MLLGFSIAYYITSALSLFYIIYDGIRATSQYICLSNLEGVSSEVVLSLETFIHDQISLIIIG